MDRWSYDKIRDSSIRWELKTVYKSMLRQFLYSAAFWLEISIKVEKSFEKKSVT